MVYLGVDIGGTGIKVGVVTKEGKLLYKDTAPTQAELGYEVLAQDIGKLIKKVMDSQNLKLDDIEAVGMGCPGSVDEKNGMVLYANNICMTNAPLCDEVRKYIDKPTYIGNDANCAALGEFFALDDKNASNFVAVTLGTGVGGGIIINKRIYTGFNGSAGELGHITLTMDGEPCTCGRKGCFEAYASVTALNRQAISAIEKNPKSLLAEKINENGGKSNGKIIFECYHKGDDTAIKVVNKYIEYVSHGLVDIVNIFQPEYLAIGGGISAQGDTLLKPIAEYVRKNSYGAEYNKNTKVVAAKLGNDAGIIGAALLAL